MTSAPYFGAPEDQKLWDKLESYLEPKHPCVICGGEDFELWAKQGYLEAQRCNACGMISVNPHFSEAGLNLLYSEYFAYRQEDLLLKEQRDVTYLIDRDWVSAFVSGGRLLDVGCSGGFFLSKFPADRWDRHGVEIAADAAEFARREFGLPVQAGNLLELEFDAPFDLVMMRGVVEHFNDPRSVLEKCCQLVKPGGHLFLTATPAGDSFAFDVYREKWRLFTPLEHIHFFSVTLLSRLLAEFGLVPVSHHYQYEETPYANPGEDFKQIRQDIQNIAQGHKEQVVSSVPFPGSMLTALWQKPLA
jgi:2-polyprenyl-3-methyl-5-hydroxy-6-metoxy-1,4-benzoquinol methylase